MHDFGDLAVLATAFLFALWFGYACGKMRGLRVMADAIIDPWMTDAVRLWHDDRVPTYVKEHDDRTRAVALSRYAGAMRDELPRPFNWLAQAADRTDGTTEVTP